MNQTNIDTMIDQAMFGADAGEKEAARKEIEKLASSKGIYPASIQGIYKKQPGRIYQAFFEKTILLLVVFTRKRVYLPPVLPYCL